MGMTIRKMNPTIFLS